MLGSYTRVFTVYVKVLQILIKASLLSWRIYSWLLISSVLNELVESQFTLSRAESGPTRILVHMINQLILINLAWFIASGKQRNQKAV